MAFIIHWSFSFFPQPCVLMQLRLTLAVQVHLMGPMWMTPFPADSSHVFDIHNF